MCGIFLDQGWNLCPLHWQAILNHCTTNLGSPKFLQIEENSVKAAKKSCGPTYLENKPVNEVYEFYQFVEF